MKFVSATTVTLTALLQAVNANFDIYAAGVGGTGIGGNGWGYQVYDGDANCDNNLEWIWRAGADVSGGKFGVRCSGSADACSGSADSAGIDELEMNFNSDDLHFTMYAGRDFGLYNGGTKVGHCDTIENGLQFFCGTQLGRAEGQHLLHCYSYITGADINDNRPV